MASTIQIRVDDDLKNKSDQLFKDLGTDTTSAIRMFLTQAVAYNGFPFEIKRTVHNPYTSMTEEEMLQRLEQSRESSKKGNYRNADDVLLPLKTTISMTSLGSKSIKSSGILNHTTMPIKRIITTDSNMMIFFFISAQLLCQLQIFHPLMITNIP